MEKQTISGFIAINKPVGVTSFDCIYKVRKLLPHKTKVGHAGTLDKEASGLMILAISREATRLLSSISGKDKQYTVKAKLGELTTTLDYSGEILESTNPSYITEAGILKAIDALGDEYEQTPPIYSALKHKGEALYKLARNKKMNAEKLEEIVKLKSRTIKIYNLELIEFSYPYFTFKAHVSKGTYVRSLADDIAKQLGTRATTHELNRTHIGEIGLEKALNFENIASANNDQILQDALLHLEEFSQDRF